MYQRCPPLQRSSCTRIHTLLRVYACGWKERQGAADIVLQLTMCVQCQLTMSAAACLSFLFPLTRAAHLYETAEARASTLEGLSDVFQVSACCYICVRMLLNVCPHATIYVSSCNHVWHVWRRWRADTILYVSAYYYTRVSGARACSKACDEQAQE